MKLTNYPLLIPSSHVGVYLSLNGRVIPEQGYVVMSTIGTVGDDTALLCFTNRPPPNSGGNWYTPNGTSVAGVVVPGVRRNRGPMVARLYRNIATGPAANGIYRCQIMDDTDTLHTLHVGLYHDGAGIAYA